MELRRDLKYHELAETGLTKHAEFNEDIMLLVTTPRMSLLTDMATKSKLRIKEISKFFDKNRLCAHGGVTRRRTAGSTCQAWPREERRHGPEVRPHLRRQGKRPYQGGFSVKASYPKLLKKGGAHVEGRGGRSEQDGSHGVERSER